MSRTYNIIDLYSFHSMGKPLYPIENFNSRSSFSQTEEIDVKELSVLFMENWHQQQVQQTRKERGTEVLKEQGCRRSAAHPRVRLTLRGTSCSPILIEISSFLLLCYLNFPFQLFYNVQISFKSLLFYLGSYFVNFTLVRISIFLFCQKLSS